MLKAEQPVNRMPYLTQHIKLNMLLTTLLTFFLASTTAAPTNDTLTKRQSTSRSPNYSGAALPSVPDGTAFSYATTQINIPGTIYVSSESSPPTIQKAAAWVGFGGLTKTGIIQTGCVFRDNGEGTESSGCWYEFYPAAPVFYDGFNPSPGDTVLLKIYRHDDTSGSSYITNLSTGEAVSADFTAPDGASCPGMDAEWIVENPGAMSNFVNFQKEFFEGCNTQTEGGNTYGPGDATYRLFNEWKDLRDGNGKTQWTSSFLPSDSEVEVDFVGPS